jgi:hypothetical protein
MKQNKGILLNRAYKSQLETVQVESTTKMKPVQRDDTTFVIKI